MPGKKKVFIVDDDEAIVVSLKKLLVVSGFEVEATLNSKEVILMVKSFRPDIILLDLLMPGLGGFDICEILNNDQEAKGIPIIIISALAGYTDIKMAFKLGVVGYLTKPYDYEELVREINKVLAYKEGKF